MNILTVENLEVTYDRVFVAVHNVTFTLEKGGVVAILGSNGAGKTTTLKAISGLLGPERGEITRGKVIYEGADLLDVPVADRVRNGVCQVLEGRRVFQHLTPVENLTAAAGGSGQRKDYRARVGMIMDQFPRLKERSRTAAGLLSGGEQQMLAIGRALMTNPKVLLLDEPSLGLAPTIIKDIFSLLKKIIIEHEVSVVLVEQNMQLALEFADRGYVIENGRVLMEGASEELLGNADIRAVYLGEGGEGKDYSKIKHYRQRRRWLV